MTGKSRGLTCAAMSYHQAALENMQQVTSLAPDHAGAWRALANLLRLSDRDAEADQADAKAGCIDSGATVWRDAAGERSAGRLELLDRKLRLRLEKIPLLTLQLDKILNIRAMPYKSPTFLNQIQ